MGSEATGSSSHKFLDYLSGELIELPSGNVALNLRIPLGGLER